MSVYTDLHDACFNGSLDDVRHFVEEEGADVNATKTDWGGMRPIHVLLDASEINQNDITLLEYLISNGADVNGRDRKGRTPLHLGANTYLVTLSTLECLISNGADVNAKDNIVGGTPLMYALCNNRNDDVVKYLVSKGADVNARNTDGHTPMDYAKEKGKTHLLPSTPSGGCYIATCVYGSYDCPEVLALRHFRDNTLSLSWLGRLFIWVYYAVSPSVVKLVGNTRWFNKIGKSVLDKILAGMARGKNI